MCMLGRSNSKSFGVLDCADIRRANEMVKGPSRNVAKTMNLAKIYQNGRSKLNKMTISYLFGGNGENSKNRRSLSRSPNEMAKGPL